MNDDMKNFPSKSTTKNKKLLIGLITIGSLVLLGASAGIAVAVADRQSATTSVQVANPVQGPAGTPGSQGETGPQGPKGRDGKDGKNADEKLLKALTGQVKELEGTIKALKAQLKNNLFMDKQDAHKLESVRDDLKAKIKMLNDEIAYLKNVIKIDLNDKETFLFSTEYNLRKSEKGKKMSDQQIKAFMTKIATAYDAKQLELKKTTSSSTARKNK